ncbi:MAG: M56 family metallopeptidase [Pirellulaceae bacterium]|nr:M56 family metallopeptidase [Pirellulaceae bacterium]
MNVTWLETIANQEICVRFTLTLLHFIWEGLVVGLLAFVLLRWLPDASAMRRYAVSLSALVLMIACLPVTYALLSRQGETAVVLLPSDEIEIRNEDASTSLARPAKPVAFVSSRSHAGSFSEGAQASAGTGSAQPRSADGTVLEGHPTEFAAGSLLQIIAPLATAAYLLGVTFMMLRLAVALCGGQRLKRIAATINDKPLRDLIVSQARRAGMRAAPAVAYCNRVSVPVVVGILKPTVLLPSSLATGMPVDQLEAIFTHELAHIRRFDLLVNLLQRLVESLLFFHPAVWYVSRLVSVERENCCDDFVLQSGFQRLQYASALVRMAELSGKLEGNDVTSQVAALAASGESPSQFKRRVMRLLGEGDRPRLRLTRADWTMATAGIALAGLLPLLAYAQQPTGGTLQDQSATDSAATESTHIDKLVASEGVPRVLMVEDWRKSGDHQAIVDVLRRQGFNVELRPSSKPLPTQAELLKFDSVILADVPRSSGEYADTLSWITDEQIELLAQNTRDFGCGLVLFGGSRSFGPGGWGGTELEKAMPVDFKWSDSENQGALVMLLHPAELRRGNHWQQVAARAAFNQLGPSDHCGVIYYTKDGTRWLWGGDRGVVQLGDRRGELLARIDGLEAGDMPDFQPAFRMALDALRRLPTASRSVLLLTDGDPAAPNQSTLKEFRQAGIPVSVVHVDLHGPVTNKLPQQIASSTSGRYYHVRNSVPAVLERIFARESRVVSRSLIYRPSQDISPKLTNEGDFVDTIVGPVPPVLGLVETKLKDNPLARASIIAPGRDGNDLPVLASWTYGLGRTAVLTTGIDSPWTEAWQTWKGRDRLLGDIVRWSMKTKVEGNGGAGRAKGGDNKIAGDLKRLQGTWALSAEWSHGGAEPAAVRDDAVAIEDSPMQLVFQSDMVTAPFSPPLYPPNVTPRQMKLRLETEGSLNVLHLTGEREDGKSETQYYLYRFRDEQLELCFFKKQRHRIPLAFKTGRASDAIIWTFDQLPVEDALDGNTRETLGEGDHTIPRWERWEIRFDSSSQQAYATQLDFFGIELGAVGGGKKTVDYARNLLKGRPDSRLGPGDKEMRFYMTWRGRNLEHFDRNILRSAGVDVRPGRLLMQFYPKQVEDRLAWIEMKNADGKTVQEFLKTVFGVREKRGGYEFFVMEQRFRPKPRDSAVAKPQITGQLVGRDGRPSNVQRAFKFLCESKTGSPLVAATKKPLGMSVVDGIDKLWHSVTDDRGSFEFDEVPLGNYKLVAQSWPGTNEIPTMNSEPSTTVRLHGVVENIKVDGTGPTQTQIRSLGEGVLKIVNDPKEPHAFLFLSRAAMIGDPILGPLGWGEEFIANAIGVTLMEDVHVTIEGLPDKNDVHVALFNYDNNPGIGGGSYRVGQQEEVRLKIYATWSNGRYDPPDRLLKLVEHFENTDLSLSKLIGLENGDARNHEELVRIAGEAPDRKVKVDELGEFRFIDTLAALRYKWLRQNHPARQKAR